MGRKKQKKAKPAKAKKKIVFQSPKGMHDILPQDQAIWEKIRAVGKNIAQLHNFIRIDTPIVEPAEIFEKGVGQDSDIVSKEMYFLKTKGDSRLVLRPEATASVMRAYFENGLGHLGQPLRLYYEGPMFRYEQPQAGRFRQFYQFGLEVLGGDGDPIYDAQVILAVYRFLEEVKIKNISLKVNNIGCHSCRQTYKKKLQNYYKKKEKMICGDCKARIKTNPLRVLDCKNEECQPVKAGAPVILDYLCSACKAHFKQVLEFLDELKLPYMIDPYLVRGLDYYNRTVFEAFAEGFDFAVAAGGRYDYLAELLGSGRLYAVGGSVGLDRVAEILKAENKIPGGRVQNKIFLVYLGEEAKKKGLALLENFRKAGVKVSESFGRESLKSQLRAADREGVEIALILGQKEVFEGSIIIRNMKTGAQETVPMHKAVEEVKKRLK